MKKRSILYCIIPTLLAPALASGAVMLLWNAVVPSLFGIAAIGFGQALGLFLLSQILSGGILLGFLLWLALFHHFVHYHRHGIHRRGEHMTDEQRREFIRKWRELRFGHYPSHLDNEDNRTTDDNKE